MKSRVSIICLIGCVLAAVFGFGLAVPALAEIKDGPYNLTPQVFDDDSGLLPKKGNPVNLPQTRVFWNGRDITDDPELRYTPTLEELLQEYSNIVTYNGIYNMPYAKGTSKDWPPCDGFSIASPNPETVGFFSEFSVDTDLLFLWMNKTLSTQNSGNYYTFACNEKTVKQISFSGLPDDALVALRPDGLELHFKEPGKYKVLYEVMDSDGVTRVYPTTYTFEIYPADIYLNPPEEDE